MQRVKVADDTYTIYCRIAIIIIVIDIEDA